MSAHRPPPLDKPRRSVRQIKARPLPQCRADTIKARLVAQCKADMQHRADLASERHIRELIVAAHTLTLIDHGNKYPPVTVRVEDLQALLRLLDMARLNTKVRKL